MAFTLAAAAAAAATAEVNRPQMVGCGYSVCAYIALALPFRAAQWLT